jgi:hypothetical protein
MHTRIKKACYFSIDANGYGVCISQKATSRKWATNTFSANTILEYVMNFMISGLIVAVVVVGMLHMGLFNPATQVPIMQPGSCRLLRQSILGGGVQVSMLGICSGRPQQFFMQFDGVESRVLLPAPLLSGTGPFTVLAWIKTNETGIVQDVVAVGSTACSGNGVSLYVDASGHVEEDLSCSAGANSAPVKVNDGKYHLIGVVYGAGKSQLYVDGTAAGNPVTQSPDIETGYNYIGTSSTSSYFKGTIANVQIYNMSLSAEEMQALYKEWVSGAPIISPNLVAWWPLDGDANDYSGNNNNGVPVNVIKTSGWAYEATSP